jgi:putative PIN family toxin of toxin-antitoxin system
VRAVLDPNVLIAALLAPQGAPAQLLSRWLGGEFELVVSEALLAELERALTYPKLRHRISVDDGARFVSLLREAGLVATDPPAPPRRSPDPGDDYLLALAESERSLVVSGDRHLLGLAGELPVRAPREFLVELETAR